MSVKKYQSEKLTFEFFPHGDIKEIITNNNTLINQVVTNEIDGSLNNLFLRIFKDDDITVYPLIGKKSHSKTYFYEEGIRFVGEIEDIDYQVEFKLAENDSWFWQISLTGTNEIIDVVYGQDIGIANKSTVQSNEAYNSQYINHSVNKNDNGYVVCSKQNMPQNGKTPFLCQGSLTKNIGFTTDGYQFFDKKDIEIYTDRLSRETMLASEVYQFEMAYTGIQSEKLTLHETYQTIIFYGTYTEKSLPKITEKKDELELKNIFNNLEKLDHLIEEVPSSSKHFGNVSGESLTPKEIEKLFPKRKIEEKTSDGTMLSFFDENDYHIVLKEKETLMERSHGHIIISGEEETIENPVMASTVYMNGLFNSQIVIGNTTMNKFISNTRSTLNLLQKSGHRLFIKLDNKWCRLGNPSAFKMGFNFATWYYKLSDDIIEINSYTISNNRTIKFKVNSQNNKNYDWLTTLDVVMGDSENKHDYMVRDENQVITFEPTGESNIYKKYPDLRFYIAYNQITKLVKTDEIFETATDDNMIVLECMNSSDFDLTIQGTLTGQPYSLENESLKKAAKSYDSYLTDLNNHFSLKLNQQGSVEKMNILVKWYTHNMLIHYLTPHGLEQYGGAAWGTRDVCQGPVEFFFAMDKPEIVRNILLTIYSNQFEDDGNWPQWFMFDQYEEIKADESHGDIIVWPLKVVGDYLKTTQDYSILYESLPYSDRITLKKTNKKESLFEHIRKQIKYIEDNFLKGTFLSCYGTGDWDDTLQPADETLKKNMTSSWTVALTYQTLLQVAKVLNEFDEDLSRELKDLAIKVYEDFRKYMLSDGIIPGFLLMEDNKEPELIVHPKDTRTGIEYRLLPMTRSMIAEILTEDEVNRHCEIIDKELVFPDAVRLMNRPATYSGGESKIFKRAEQAANFGREVGLAYIHAHIRYVEAMAKIGKTEETWGNLEKINPIGIIDKVPNSLLRQSNAYFSSSDGDFKNRYDAQEEFNRLKTGDCDVKGGWRIYSSGPGIYINQLVSNVLGIRVEKSRIIFDPVLPNELDGLRLTYKLKGRLLNIEYHLNTEKNDIIINGKHIDFTERKNKYRRAGFYIEMDDFYTNTVEDKENNIVLNIEEV